MNLHATVKQGSQTFITLQTGHSLSMLVCLRAVCSERIVNAQPTEMGDLWARFASVVEGYANQARYCLDVPVTLTMGNLQIEIEELPDIPQPGLLSEESQAELVELIEEAKRRGRELAEGEAAGIPHMDDDEALRAAYNRGSRDDVRMETFDEYKARVKRAMGGIATMELYEEGVDSATVSRMYDLADKEAASTPASMPAREVNSDPNQLYGPKIEENPQKALSAWGAIRYQPDGNDFLPTPEKA
jgi:hypothetical protein